MSPRELVRSLSNQSNSLSKSVNPTHSQPASQPVNETIPILILILRNQFRWPTLFIRLNAICFLRGSHKRRFKTLFTNHKRRPGISFHLGWCINLLRLVDASSQRMDATAIIIINSSLVAKLYIMEDLLFAPKPFETLPLLLLASNAFDWNSIH